MADLKTVNERLALALKELNDARRAGDQDKVEKLRLEVTRLKAQAKGATKPARRRSSSSSRTSEPPARRRRTTKQPEPEAPPEIDPNDPNLDPAVRFLLQQVAELQAREAERESRVESRKVAQTGPTYKKGDRVIKGETEGVVQRVQDNGRLMVKWAGRRASLVDPEKVRHVGRGPRRERRQRMAEQVEARRGTEPAQRRPEPTEPRLSPSGMTLEEEANDLLRRIRKVNETFPDPDVAQVEEDAMREQLESIQNRLRREGGTAGQPAEMPNVPERLTGEARTRQELQTLEEDLVGGEEEAPPEESPIRPGYELPAELKRLRRRFMGGMNAPEGFPIKQYGKLEELYQQAMRAGDKNAKQRLRVGMGDLAAKFRSGQMKKEGVVTKESGEIARRRESFRSAFRKMTPEEKELFSELLGRQRGRWEFLRETERKETKGTEGEEEYAGERIERLLAEEEGPMAEAAMGMTPQEMNELARALARRGNALEGLRQRVKEAGLPPEDAIRLLERTIERKGLQRLMEETPSGVRKGKRSEEPIGTIEELIVQGLGGSDPLRGRRDVEFFGEEELELTGEPEYPGQAVPEEIDEGRVDRLAERIQRTTGFEGARAKQLAQEMIQMSPAEKLAALGRRETMGTEAETRQTAPGTRRQRMNRFGKQGFENPATEAYIRERMTAEPEPSEAIERLQDVPPATPDIAFEPFSEEARAFLREQGEMTDEDIDAYEDYRRRLVRAGVGVREFQEQRRESSAEGQRLERVARLNEAIGAVRRRMDRGRAKPGDPEVLRQMEAEVENLIPSAQLPRRTFREHDPERMGLYPRGGIGEFVTRPHGSVQEPAPRGGAEAQRLAGERRYLPQEPEFQPPEGLSRPELEEMGVIEQPTPEDLRSRLAFERASDEMFMGQENLPDVAQLAEMVQRSQGPVGFERRRQHRPYEPVAQGDDLDRVVRVISREFAGELDRIGRGLEGSGTREEWQSVAGELRRYAGQFEGEAETGALEGLADDIQQVFGEPGQEVETEEGEVIREGRGLDIRPEYREPLPPAPPAIFTPADRFNELFQKGTPGFGGSERLNELINEPVVHRPPEEINELLRQPMTFPEAPEWARQPLVTNVSASPLRGLVGALRGAGGQAPSGPAPGVGLGGLPMPPMPLPGQIVPGIEAQPLQPGGAAPFTGEGLQVIPETFFGPIDLFNLLVGNIPLEQTPIGQAIGAGDESRMSFDQAALGLPQGPSPRRRLPMFTGAREGVR